MKFYDPKNKRLVYLDLVASSDFWGKLWQQSLNIKSNNLTGRFDFLVLPTTQKYLQPGEKILEGGCGDGHFVKRLKEANYRCIGVDFSRKTVERINKVDPDLDVHYANVLNLPFKDAEFNGYWSIGVIEHFFKGYDKIISEAKRVLQSGGYFFLTFPQMSILRKIKAKLKMYPLFKQPRQPKDFYQFALDPQNTINHISNFGFKLKERKSFDGFKGLREELNFGEFFFAPLSYYSKSNIFVAGIRFLISKVFERLSGHSVLLVFKKE